MRGTVRVVMGVVVLAAFSAAATAVVTNHWPLDGDELDAVGINDGTPNGGVGHYSFTGDVSDVAIYDPLSATTRANTGSALFTTGGNWEDTGINVGNLDVMDTFWEAWTVETIFKAPPGQIEETHLFGRWQNDPTASHSQFFGMGFVSDPDDLFGVMAAHNFGGALFPTSTTEPVTDSEWRHAAMTYSHSGDTWSDAGDPEPTFTLTMGLWLDYQHLATQTIEWTGFLQQRPGDPWDHLPSTARGTIGMNRGSKVLTDVNIDEVRILDYMVPDGANGLDHFLQPVPEPATVALLGIGGILAVLRRRRR